MKKIFSIIIAIIVALIPINISQAAYKAHAVQKNESLYTISKMNNIDLDYLKSLNEMHPDALHIIEGQALRLNFESKLNVKINYQDFRPDTPILIINNRTMLPIRHFLNTVGFDKIIWNQQYKTAYASNSKDTLSFTLGKNTFNYNEHSVYSDTPIVVYENRLYVPLRVISEQLGYSVNWNNQTSTASIQADKQQSIQPPVTSSKYTEEDILWLARIIEAEAGSESYEGKLAVANVVLNRVKSNQFPNDIYDVIFDKTYAVQYTPAYNGTIYNKPSSQSYKAARQAANDINNIGKALYFLNPRKVPNSWIIRNRTFYKRIGNHDFYL